MVTEWDQFLVQLLRGWRQFPIWQTCFSMLSQCLVEESFVRDSDLLSMAAYAARRVSYFFLRHRWKSEWEIIRNCSAWWTVSQLFYNECNIPFYHISFYIILVLGFGNWTLSGQLIQVFVCTIYILRLNLFFLFLFEDPFSRFVCYLAPLQLQGSLIVVRTENEISKHFRFRLAACIHLALIHMPLLCLHWQILWQKISLLACHNSW